MMDTGMEQPDSKIQSIIDGLKRAELLEQWNSETQFIIDRLKQVLVGSKMSDYHRIPEEEYNKLKFQLRGQYVAILNVFRCYGMDADVEQAIEECVKVAENFGMAIRGKKKPIHIYHEPKRRITEG